MFKILLISLITFMIVIIAFLILMSFLDVDIITHSKIIEKFNSDNVSITGGGYMRKFDDSNTNYFIQFNSNGTLVITSSITYEVFMIGGGGGAGYNHGGGGGAGAYYYDFITLEPGEYTINIGDGGAGGIGDSIPPQNGGDTFITSKGRDITINGNSVRCRGGGAGGWLKDSNGRYKGKDGGCGGGADGWNWNHRDRSIYIGGATNNTGTIGTGFKGGNSIQVHDHGYLAGGGGGGIGGIGGDYSGREGGNGGNPLVIDITDVEQAFGGGGGGGEWPHHSRHPAGIGGTAILRNGTISKVGGDAVRNEGGVGENGVTNTGSGGGSGKGSRGGSGGSGVVIFRFNNNFYKDLRKLFDNKKPWGKYIAHDFNNGEQQLKDTSGNDRHAEISGNIMKTTGSGNGATGNISYISGGTSSIISWPAGSIPSNFTILSLTRYNGGSRGRILSDPWHQNLNWLHGHWGGNRGMCYYSGWIKHHDRSIGNLYDWLCCIGKNGGSVPNNILLDGVPSGIWNGGRGGGTLRVNGNWGEHSDWALSCVIIWDQHLNDFEMRLLNKMIKIHKSSGMSINDIIDTEGSSSGVSTYTTENGIQLRDDPEFNKNNGALDWNEFFDSTRNLGNIDGLKLNDVIVPNDRTTPLTLFNQNRFNNLGVFIGGNNSIGEKISITFNKSFVLKKISIIAGSKLEKAPSEWTINLGGNNVPLTGTATNEDYGEIVGKSKNNCIKFYIDNKISSQTYDIIFTKTLGGTQLDFSKIILYEGLPPPVY